MRHGNKNNNLSRKKGHRRALLMNLANALVRHKRINTTLAKAKALRIYMEPLVTKGKNNTTHSRRVVFSYLQDKHSIDELFGPIAQKVGERPGGYLRIIKMGFRRGDGTDMAMIEFVDFNDVYVKGEPKGAGSEKQGRKRTRRSGKSKAAETTAAAATVAAATVAATEATSEEE